MDRLPTGFAQPDDRQPPVSERYLILNPRSFLIGPSVSEHTCGLFRPMDLRASYDADESTHDASIPCGAKSLTLVSRDRWKHYLQLLFKFGSSERPRVDTATRFAFGKNWRNYARTVDEETLERGQESLNDLFELDLKGRSFLDVGCGSGLFTASALLMGAEVTAFDFDSESVATTIDLLERFDICSASSLSVRQGSVLDKEFLEQLGRFDIVYSWGVLHHTGAMWCALENVAELAGPGGFLAVALYNDQGTISRVWRVIKRSYVALPALMRPLLVLAIVAPYEISLFLKDAITLRPRRYLRRWTHYGDDKRGMSRLHNHIDWIGGYPFEVASPQSVIDFFTRGGSLLRSS